MTGHLRSNSDRIGKFSFDSTLVRIFIITCDGLQKLIFDFILGYQSILDLYILVSCIIHFAVNLSFNCLE